MRRAPTLLKLIAPALACTLTGCMALDPPPTIATVGGAEAGRRLDHAPTRARIRALTDEILALSPTIDPAEAADCAELAVRYTSLLAEYHNLTTVAEFNSLMVNLGIKDRGQCFQLADDLNAELEEQHYRTILRTRAICHWDEPFKEHNCIVLTAPGQPFEEGLVIDPWRNPGTLRWARVKNDVYPWIPRVVHPSAHPDSPPEPQIARE